MQGFNKDDWEIIREYKKKQKARLNDELKRYKKLGNKFERDIRDSNAQIARYERNASELEQEKENIDSSMVPAELQLEIDLNQGKLNTEKEHVKDLESDLALARRRESEIVPEISKVSDEIEYAEKRISMCQRVERVKLAAGGSHEVIVGCKKCRISDIKISNKEKDDRNYTQLVWPENEPNLPELHVVSTSKPKSSDVITIDFGGACGHGNNAKPADNVTYTKSERLTGNNNICPRVEVSCAETGTTVKRQSGTKVAVPAKKIDKGDVSDIEFAFRKLIFGSVAEKANYNLEFHSCKGRLPFKAQIVSHPSYNWKIKFTCGYTEKKRDEYQKKSDDFDGIPPDGDWKVKTEGSYTIDGKNQDINYEYSVHTFLDQLGSNWPYLSEFMKFMEPLNGFLEVAKTKAEIASENSSDPSPVKANILWPQLVIDGSYDRVELEKSPSVGGVGHLKLGFAPLIGAEGELDIIQVVLLCLTGSFAGFFRKASNLSVGKKAGDGTIDKSKPYAETKLELKLGIETNVSGQLDFVCGSDGKWSALNNAAAIGTQESSKTGVTGLVGFKLSGAAKAEGQWLIVKFSVGAEFKTVSEDGSKASGIEIDVNPIRRESGFGVVGKIAFNGLSVIYSVYKKAGAEGGDQGTVANRRTKPSWGQKPANEKVELSNKKEKKKDLMKSRDFFTFGDVVTIDV